MRHNRIDHAHLVGLLGRVGSAEEEDFAGALLAHLTGEVRGAKAPIETRHVRVRLLEHGVLLARNRHVTDHMQAVASSYSPSRNDSNHHLVHETNLTLHIEDVETIHAVFTCVAGVGADVLISPAAKGPSAILRRRPLSCDQHHPNVLAFVAGDEGLPKLVHRLGREGIAHLRTVERDARHTLVHFEGDFVVLFDRFPRNVCHVAALRKWNNGRSPKFSTKVTRPLTNTSMPSYIELAIGKIQENERLGRYVKSKKPHKSLTYKALKFVLAVWTRPI